MNDKNKSLLSVALCATVGAGLFYFVSKYRKNIFKKLRLNNPFLQKQEIHVINNLKECSDVLKKLKIHCSEYNVIGFDCEWVTVNGSRRPIALLQLSTHKGLCALIRLCNLKRIPPELKELLENNEVIKVGVAPYDDATYMARDYGICVASTLDLRHIAFLADVKPEGLSKLSKSLLNIELDKNWRLRCSNWEAHVLTETQIDYAAKDAYVAIEIFKNLFNRIYGQRFLFTKTQQKKGLDDFLEFCEIYLDKSFKHNANKCIGESFLGKNGKKNSGGTKNIFRGMCTRTKPLYDNCYLEAPDGETLCTCDRKKANWYIHNNLGVEVKNEPFTVRLNFEPAGRAVGDVGKFYLSQKKNQCVVCGKNESYLRKNVVPRVYRKLLPEIMKDHSSHDIVLLCIHCHQRSDMADLKVRQKLAVLCDAPLCSNETSKFKELPHMKKIRSAARALLDTKHNIPPKRKTELENVIKSFHPNEELTFDFLTNLCTVEVNEFNETYQSHGEVVVNFFKNRTGGLVELEKMWREHFVNTMKPKYLPKLWSTTHNSSRLEIRADEGRINIDEMLAAGIDLSKLKKHEENSKTKNTDPTDKCLENEILPSKDLITFDDDFKLNNVSGTDDNSVLGLTRGMSHNYDSDDTDSLLSQPSDIQVSDVEIEDVNFG